MRTRTLLTFGLLVATVAAASSSASARSVERRADPGFVASTFAQTGGTPSSLAWGKDTRGGKGTRLYVADNSGNQVLVIDDLGGAGSTPTVFATGFRGPLGVLPARDGSLYVTDAEAAREGPFGLRSYGRVWRVFDTDHDGVADKKYVVLKDLPNGRHNTNGMAFGPDGMLYVANGNSTDDGTDGGETEVKPWSGSLVRVDPDARNVSITALPRRKTLVASGWRNVYDVAFSPVEPNYAFVPMNGVDDAREGSTGENPADPDIRSSDDVLFATNVADRHRDNFRFPSCLYNVEERGNLTPYDNPNAKTIETFGHCPTSSVPRPVGSFGLHVSADGAAFQTTGNWGAAYRNNLFVAEWGSLFGAPTGHQIARVVLTKDGLRVASISDFLDVDTPLDVTFDRAGVMYVADYSGSIVRVDQVP
ncbi:MAG TPA: hypothetical protein VFK89_08745 [Actinomycetota bacterium]|nr:hypothetical protein [Actinomycetota bacterium]